MAWGAIQWPWLARSLWGGKLADKHALLDRLGLWILDLRRGALLLKPVLDLLGQR